MVNKDPINNHYATLLIPLSQGEQEGKKTDALTADKDLIPILLFEGKDCIRDSHGFSALYNVSVMFIFFMGNKAERRTLEEWLTSPSSSPQFTLSSTSPALERLCFDLHLCS